MVRRGIEPIIPARRTNRRATHQDGRELRRYRHRVHIERTFAWLGHIRRLVIRCEHLVTTYTGLLPLACAVLTLKRVFKQGLTSDSAFRPKDIGWSRSAARFGAA